MELSRQELRELMAPVMAASLASAYFTAMALPENKDADPDVVLAQVIDVFKACNLECVGLGIVS